VPTNNVQGDLQNVSTPTFMAINGNGYFIVKKPDNFSGGQLVFSGVNLYIRRGDFQSDKNGFLVNQVGYYLMGLPVGATTGNPQGSVPVVLQFTNNLISGADDDAGPIQRKSTSEPITASTQSGVPSTSLLDPTAFSSSPIVGATSAAAITGNAATLSQNAQALGTGTVTLAAGTQLDIGAGLNMTVGTTITVTTATGVSNYIVVAGNHVSDLIAAISGGAIGVPASVAACKSSPTISSIRRRSPTPVAAGGQARPYRARCA